MTEVERRETHRRKSRVKRTVLGTLVREDQENLHLHLYIVDLSEAGMRVNLDRQFAVDSRIHLGLNLASLGHGLKGDLRLECRVVWTRPLAGGTCVHGLEFLDLDDIRQEMVQTLLDHCAERPDQDMTFLPEPVDTKVWFPGDQGWSPMVATRQLSVFGCTFASRRRLEPDEEIKVRLLLEAGTAQAEARVRWCREMKNGNFDICCDFLEPDRSTQDYIALHLRRRT